MAISSMTGFARAVGQSDGMHWQWEVKSLNGKALDLRCRLPAGFEGLEPSLRTIAAEVLRRGTLQVSLAVTGAGRSEEVRLNHAVLEDVIAAGEVLRNRIGGEPLRADQLLTLRGVLDILPLEEDEDALRQRHAKMLDSYAEAVKALAAARREEGARLGSIVEAQIGRIEALVFAARDNPARQPDAIRRRLADQVARLMDTGADFDPVRLHQEAMLIATRSDVEEEIDRLMSHLAAARTLLSSGDAIGRKFDFLAQEFNREANTLCSKAIDNTLTAIGLELKTVIDQMREQIQNIE
ncbi:MAG: YicC family protein [Alphaproteobacteria bacterium]|nr:YicC family protein [Alphaproteobacteria bacterium]